MKCGTEYCTWVLRQIDDIKNSKASWNSGCEHIGPPLSGGKVYHQINVAAVGGWTTNYRVPDLVLLTPERFGIDHNEYFEGAPSAVVEIRSPGDETYEKLPFYAQLAVPEVWIFDRDTRQPELLQLGRDQYRPQAADAAGWLTSQLGVQFRVQSPGSLLMRLKDRDNSQTVLSDG